MSNEVAKATTFQERVFAEIKGKIGDLMTEAEIKKLVDAAMKEAFFTGERLTKKTYPYDEVYTPPYLVTLIRELVGDKVKLACDEWIKANPVEWNKVIEELLAKKFLDHVKAYIEGVIYEPLNQISSALRNKGIL